MESNKQEDTVTTGSTDVAAKSDKKRKLKIYGGVAAALVFGAIGVYALLFSKAAILNVAQLQIGQTLYVNQALVSDSILHNAPGYQAVMQGDGNFVVYNSANKAMWSTRTAGTGSNNRLVLQTDGNLVLYTSANKAVWNSGTVQSNTLLLSEKLVMQTDGNLVLYSNNTALWSSWTGHINIPKNLSELTSGQTLYANQSLVSVLLSNYRAVMQTDGNLVVYTSANKAIWSSGTAGTGSNNRLVLQTDGNLVVYTSANKPVWNAGSVQPPSMAQQDKLVMQGDGNLVLYSGHTGAVWSSFTGL